MWLRFLALLSGLRMWHFPELWCRLQTQLGSRVAVAVWCRLAAAALIGPLTWEVPHAMGAALKSKKKRKRKERDSMPFKLDPFGCWRSCVYEK